MDMGHYVNAPVDEGRNGPEDRGHSDSGQSKVVWLVGLSFGLLCIVQSALNVSLRLHGIWSCNQSDYSDNFTLMSAAHISALLLEEDRLTTENMELRANNSRLLTNNETLHEQLSKQRDQIMELQTEKEMLMKRLSEIEPQIQNCPVEWRPYMSSCYQLSNEQMSWRHANDDCVAKGAHLVILNDEREEGFIHTLGSEVWIGLKSTQKRQRKTWTWVDGSQLTYPNRMRRQADHPGFYCAYCEQTWFGSAMWVAAACEDQHNWVCEKEMK
ncbi:CD209 antigen-like protein E [Chelmon rostratus]|uniref:CD209 antigen-like protein E n=1 Tax=Chelmon rostratus TaxID=109905 RepID=UPI001BEA13CC|nr:CD209 antigen-like protein E [Chelmon rostratus]